MMKYDLKIVSPLKMLLIEICQRLIDFVSATLLVCVGVSGEINNGIKKESVGKDAARMWINDGIKMQNISHSLVTFFGTMLTKMIINKQENIVVTVSLFPYMQETPRDEGGRRA